VWESADSGFRRGFHACAQAWRAAPERAQKSAAQRYTVDEFIAWRQACRRSRDGIHRRWMHKRSWAIAMTVAIVITCGGLVILETAQ
jgi:hypothetical protein